MMKTPKAFQIYLDMKEQFDALSDEQAGRVIKAALSYAQDLSDTEPDDDGMVRLVYIVMKNQIKRDFERYQNRLKANRENGRKGGAPVGNQNAKKRGFDDLIELCFSPPKTTETRQEKKKKKEKEEDKYKEKEKKENKEENKEQEKDKEKEENRSQHNEDILCEQIVSLYHSLCPKLSKNVSFVDTDAVERIRALPNFLSFEHLFDTVRRSDFLSGRSGKWTGCDLSWILNPDHARKILSGAYDNPRAGDRIEPSSDIRRHKSLFDE